VVQQFSGGGLKDPKGIFSLDSCQRKTSGGGGGAGPVKESRTGPETLESVNPGSSESKIIEGVVPSAGKGVELYVYALSGLEREGVGAG